MNMANSILLRYRPQIRTISCPGTEKDKRKLLTKKKGSGDQGINSVIRSGGSTLDIGRTIVPKVNAPQESDHMHFFLSFPPN